MRRDGVYTRDDGKFEVWVKIPGGLDCKGVFTNRDKALWCWVQNQPGPRRAFTDDAVPTYTSADLESNNPEVARKIRALLNAHGMQAVLEELIGETLRGAQKEPYLTNLAYDLAGTLERYKARYD